MKAVEVQNFRRGENPYKAMGIGHHELSEEAQEAFIEHNHEVAWNLVSAIVDLDYLIEEFNEQKSDIKDKINIQNELHIEFALDAYEEYIDYCVEVNNDFHVEGQVKDARNDLEKLREKYKVNESVGFKRGVDPYKALDIGPFKNLIDWDNLPRNGMWRVIAGHDDSTFDECFIDISYDIRYVKSWDSSGDGGKWAREWYVNDLKIAMEGKENFEEWLKLVDAFNLIPFEVIDYDEPPGWENIEAV